MSAFDPKRRFATVKYCIAKGSSGLDVGSLTRRRSPNGTLWNVGSDHSGLMLANLITFAHFSTSAVMKV
jgi:hypothetical protein